MWLRSQFQTLFYHQYQARFFCNTHHKTLIKPSYCKFSLKCLEYSRLRLSLGEKFLEGREVLKSALALTNPRQ